MYRYGYDSFGGFGAGASALCLLTWIVVLIDLVFVGVWLWQQISKK